jgi:BirA family transcriptional regulator, biotin operon repressor / biotin---[acetyl-CoA-carboxylase] ligase
MREELPPTFREALAASARRRGTIGADVRYSAETTSTNDIAASLAAAGAAEGTLVLASAQSAGRGRFGRSWFSPPGSGLYFSVVFRDSRVASLLTLAAGVAVCEGIRTATGLPVEIKWPNDIVLRGGSRGARRKISGVLAEASSDGRALGHVVLGIGVNLRPAAYPSAIADRATSIETELGRPVDAGPLLAEILVALNEQATRLRAGDSMTALVRWKALAPSAEGASVEWNSPTGVQRGRTAGIDTDGALLVVVGGRTERIVGGELRWS